MSMHSGGGDDDGDQQQQQRRELLEVLARQLVSDSDNLRPYSGSENSFAHGISARDMLHPSRSEEMQQREVGQLMRRLASISFNPFAFDERPISPLFKAAPLETRNVVPGFAPDFDAILRAVGKPSSSGRSLDEMD